jgi:DNA-binding Lrp family transcriptional regulator
MEADETADPASSEARRAAFQAAWDARLLPLLTPVWQPSKVLADAVGAKHATVLERLKDMLTRNLIERRVVKVVPSKPTKSGKRPRVHTARFEAQFRLPAR